MAKIIIEGTDEQLKSIRVPRGTSVSRGDLGQNLEEEGRSKAMQNDWKDDKIGELRETLRKAEQSHENAQKAMGDLRTEYEARVEELKGKMVLIDQQKQALGELEDWRIGKNHLPPGEVVKTIEDCPNCRSKLTGDEVRRLMKLVNIHEAPRSFKISAEDRKKLKKFL